MLQKKCVSLSIMIEPVEISIAVLQKIGKAVLLIWPAPRNE